jgi:hypothetical protein
MQSTTFLTTLTPLFLATPVTLGLCWAAGEAFKDFANELRRVHAEVDRVKTERQRVEEQLLAANEQVARVKVDSPQFRLIHKP